MVAVPSARTWVTGEVVTAAEMNSQVRDALNFLLNRPAMIRSMPSWQSVAANTLTTIVFSTNELDNDNIAGGSTSNFVIQTSGRYRVSSALTFPPAAGGSRIATVQINGVNYASGRAAASSTDAVTAFVQWTGYITAGAVVNIAAVQNSGGSLAVGSFDGSTIDSHSNRVEILMETVL